jgi:UDP-N-acetyl-D-galactosamine dehydrogenase
VPSLNFLEKLQSHQESIAVIGLGYVGLPLAYEFSKQFHVIGFDINQNKVEQYKQGLDTTNEVGNENIRHCKITFTSDEQMLKQCKFHIISVPTPIRVDKTPDLAPIISATETVARQLTPGSIIVYESTVYPGTTEEVCLPILQRISGLKHGVDFKIGYSPERINPGDTVNRLTNITKIVSGCDDDSLHTIASVYESIIQAGVFRAESIKVAEAAKIIENSQRDINIALMNEFAMVFNRMGISTKAVLDAASTKWNFMRFNPGLVGGHCIGVDPYYFIYKAEQLGYHSQIVLSGRMVNDDMAKYVAGQILKTMLKHGQFTARKPKIGLLGLTFKENCADIRNTKVVDLIEELIEHNTEVLVYDPIADAAEVYHEYGIRLVNQQDLQQLDCIVLAVAHSVFKETFSLEVLDQCYRGSDKVLIDIKSMFDRNLCITNGFTYWSL